MITQKNIKHFYHKLHQLPYWKHYIPMSKFKGTHKKMWFYHTVCNNFIHMRPGNLFSGAKCYYCSIKRCAKKRRMSDKKFKRKFSRLSYSKDYVQLSKCRGSHKKIKFYHKPCKHIIWISPEELFAGHKCKYCGLKIATLKRRQSLAEIKHRIYKLVGNEYTLLSHNVKMKNYGIFRHNKCGHVFKMKLACFIEAGERCPKCAKYVRAMHCRHTTKWFKHQIYIQAGTKYSVIGKYTRIGDKVLMQHNTKHPHRFWIKADNFLQGHRCPICALHKRQSYGERDVAYVLHKHGLIKNIDYYYGYILNTYKLFGDKNESLHADFYLPHIKYDNSNLNGIIIEFDGIQHLKLMSYFTDTNDPYWQLMEFACENSNDILKDYYCMIRHIKIIRIPNMCNYEGNRLSKLVSSVLNTKLFNKYIQLSLF